MGHKIIAACGGVVLKMFKFFAVQHGKKVAYPAYDSGKYRSGSVAKNSWSNYHVNSVGLVTSRCAIKTLIAFEDKERSKNQIDILDSRKKAVNKFNLRNSSWFIVRSIYRQLTKFG